jgi:hypothetical protein
LLVVLCNYLTFSGETDFSESPLPRHVATRRLNKLRAAGIAPSYVPRIPASTLEGVAHAARRGQVGGFVRTTLGKGYDVFDDIVVAADLHVSYEVFAAGDYRGR